MSFGTILSQLSDYFNFDDETIHPVAEQFIIKGGYLKPYIKYHTDMSVLSNSLINSRTDVDNTLNKVINIVNRLGFSI